MIFEKILLGITLAAPIGPVSVEMIKRGLNYGFWSAFKVRVGGAIGNTICLVASYLSLASLLKSPLIIGLIGLVGASYLITMGVQSIRKQHVQLSPPPSSKLIQNIEGSAIISGLILSLANPVSIVFWLGIFASTFDPKEIGLSNFAYDLFIILGVVIWGIILSSLLAVGKHLLSEKNILIITKIAGVLLLLLGAKYIWLNLEKIFS